MYIVGDYSDGSITIYQLCNMGWLIFMWFVILIVMLILYFIMIAFKVSKLYHDIEKRQNDDFENISKFKERMMK